MNNKLRLVLMVVFVLGLSILAVTACGQSEQTSATGKFTYLESNYEIIPPSKNGLTIKEFCIIAHFLRHINLKPATSA
jgi:hypothetical protein